MGTWTPGGGPTEGDDFFTGDETNETASGGGGADELTGNGGDDVLNGDAGNDTLRWNSGNDTLDGGEGDDFLLLTGASQTATVTLIGGAGSDLLRVGTQNTEFASGSTITGIETLALFGSIALEPTLLSGFTNIWSQGISSIRLTTPGVVDFSSASIPQTFTMFPGTFLQSTTNDASFSMTGSTGNDTIIMPSAAGALITINAFVGNDIVTGSGRGDNLTGGDGDDVVNGGGGNDIIHWVDSGVEGESAGSDQLNGDAGDDIIWLSNPASVIGVLTIDGGDGYDIAVMGAGTLVAGTTFANIEVLGLGPTLQFSTSFNYTAANGRVYYAPELLSELSVPAFFASGRLYPTAPGVTDLTALNMPATLAANGSTYNAGFFWEGTSGDDTLLMPLDTLAGPIQGLGNDGNDYISDGARGDLLVGGNGNDTLIGNGGDDTLEGRAHNDILSGGDGNDTLLGGDNIDTLEGGAGNDTLNGDAGNDILTGGDGVDKLNGGDGNDTIYWDAADDLANVLGGNGIDVLVFTSGAAPTTFNLSSHSFNTAEGRFTDTGVNPWATQTFVYDSQWRLDTALQINDSGTREATDYDQTNLQTWSSNFTRHDELGRLDTSVLTYDDGSRAIVDYDQANAFSWLTDWHSEDALGRVDAGVLTNDDGSLAVVDYDQANAFTWVTDWHSETALGQVDTGVLTYDDGSRAVNDYDQGDAFDWITDWHSEDALGRVDTQVTTYDDGTRAVNDYDQANAFDWLTDWHTEDALGRTDTQVVTFDDGRYAVTDYDQADEHSWATMWWLYDENGVLLSFVGTNDDGSHF